MLTNKMTRGSRGRPSTYKKRPASLDRHTSNMALNIVARKVEAAKANNGGVVKYKMITDIVESMKPTIPWLTKDMLKNHMKKLEREYEASAREPPQQEQDDINAAILANGNGRNDSSTLSSLTLEDAIILDKNTTAANGSTTEDVNSTVKDGTTTLGGRPKGTNAKSQREYDDNNDWQCSMLQGNIKSF